MLWKQLPTCDVSLILISCIRVYFHAQVWRNATWPWQHDRNNKYKYFSLICASLPLTVCFLPASFRIWVQQQSRDCGLPSAGVQDRRSGGEQEWGCEGYWGHQWGHIRRSKSLYPVPGSDTSPQLYRTRTVESNCRSTDHRIWYEHRPHWSIFHLCKCPAEISVRYCICWV